MTWLEVIAAAVGGYLIGSISFARIVATRVLPGQSLSQTEYPVTDDFSLVADGVSPGAVGRRAGAKAGGLATIGDVGKGALAAGVMWILFGRDAAAIAGAAAVLGHVAPVWYRFEGGFGQSPIIGSSLVLNPLSVPFGIIVGNGAAWVFAEFMIGGLLWPLFLILWGPLVGDATYLWYALAVNAMYVWRVFPQIQQRYRYRRSARLDRAARIEEIKESYRNSPFDQPTGSP